MVSPTVDATGSKDTGSGDVLTWTHVVGSGATLLLVGIAYGMAPVSGTPTVTVSYNGVSMTSLGRQQSGNDVYGFIELFKLESPPAGSHTISTNLTNPGGTTRYLGASVSYVGVGTIGTPALGYETDSSGISVNVPTTSGDLAVLFAVCGQGFASVTSPSTQDALLNGNSNSGAGNIAAAHRAATSSSTTIAIAIDSGDDYTGTIALALSPTATTNTGTLDAVLPAVTGSVPGVLTNPATLTAAVPATTGQISGTLTNPGSLAAEVAPLAGDVPGILVNPGSIAATVPPIRGSIDGVLTNRATIDGTLPPLTAAVEGTLTNPGALNAVLPLLLASIGESTVIHGTLNAMLPTLTGTLTGRLTNPASLDGTLPLAEGTLIGDLINPGALDAVLPLLIASIRSENPTRDITLTGRSLTPRFDAVAAGDRFWGRSAADRFKETP